MPNQPEAVSCSVTGSHVASNGATLHRAVAQDGFLNTAVATREVPSGIAGARNRAIHPAQRTAERI